METPEKRTALIVDDDPFFCRILQQFLTPWRLNVSTASSLEGARALMERFTFDLYIVDLQLPDGDASELLVPQGLRDPTLASRCVVVTSFPMVATYMIPYPTADKASLVSVGAHFLRILGPPDRAGQLRDTSEFATVARRARAGLCCPRRPKQPPSSAAMRFWRCSTMIWISSGN